MQNLNQVTLKVDKKSESSIDGNRCVNCGKCEEFCPVVAISEYQKEVCHLCPTCTEMKAVTVDKMYNMTSEACTLACPLGISPQGYINLLKAGRYKEAHDIMSEKNPMTLICGYICHHPCEDVCKRGTLVDDPMKIRALKRYLGEMFLNEKPYPYPKLNDLQIAVIGAGPAGLTVAHLLAQKGYNLTVFDQYGEAGGMLMRGIPDFRLDKKGARIEISKLEEAGIKFEFNRKLDPADIEDMLKKYEKVVVATGMQIGKMLPVEGCRSQNVMTAMALMERVNAGKNVKMYGNCVVIGGGSVAMDTARTALRMGATAVTTMSLECGENMPAHQWEIKEAEEEGIIRIEGVAPKRFLGAGFDLVGVEYTQIEDLDLKTCKFNIVEGTEKTISADFVIIATGQSSDKDWEAQANVVLAGDIAGGSCSVIDAMASGREAAIKIDNELMNREYIDYEVKRETKLGERKYKVYPAIRQKLQFEGVKKLDEAYRITNFDLVEIELNDDEAELEVLRCLSCGYRKIDTEKCIGCGICQKICPKGDVISMIAVPKNEEEGKIL